MKHSAYNITTGEIICTDNGNYLKKLVKIRNHTDAKIFHCYGNKWVFAHGNNSLEKVCEKAGVTFLKNPLMSL